MKNNKNKSIYYTTQATHINLFSKIILVILIFAMMMGHINFGVIADAITIVNDDSSESISELSDEEEIINEEPSNESSVNTETGNNDNNISNPETSNPSTELPENSQDDEVGDGLIGDIITTQDGYRMQMNEGGKSYSIIEYFGVSKNVEIPSTYLGLPITRILDTAFYGNTTARKIYIPESVIFVGEYTFHNLSKTFKYNEYENGNYIGSINNPYYYFVGPTDKNITEISLHEDTIIVGSYAFDECKNLKSVEIGNNVISMGYAVFGKASKVEKITIPFVGENGKNDTNAHFGYIFGARTVGGNISYVPLSLKEVNINGGSYIKHNAMYGVDMIETITLPFLGSSISDTENNYFSYIFGGKSYEENIIPQSIKNVTVLGGDISYGAFYKAIYIEEVKLLTRNISSLNFTFYDCTNLESITIPNSITEIKTNTFYDCKNLKNILFEQGSQLKTIDSKVFKDCTNLGSITIPSGVKIIESSTFENCTNLKEVIFEENSQLTTIKSNAFKTCTNLEKISIPNNVTEIDSDVFSGCNNLYYNVYDNANYLGNNINPYMLLMEPINKEITSLKINENTKFVKYGALSGCNVLASITLPFIGVSIYKTTYNTHFGSIFGASSISQNTSYVPSSLKEVTITCANSIISEAFYNCKYIERINVPNNILSVGTDAFYGCTSLKYNTYGNANYIGNEENPYIVLVETINKEIVNVNINNNTKIICCNAFNGCTSLTNVIIPNNVIELGGYAFKDCTNLASITLSENIQYIYSFTFDNCISLNNILIPRSVTTIFSYGFYNCTGLSSIEIPNNVIDIEDYAFENCNGLLEITFEENSQLEKIGYYSFKGCTGLTSITIPNSVTFIGSSAFNGCTSLENLSIPFVGKSLNSNYDTHFGYIFGANSSSDNNSYVPSTLKEVIITGGSTIGTDSFLNCTSIESVIIQTGITTIGSGAFEGCTNLIRIEIPNSITYIEDGAFEYCSNLEDVYYNGTLENWCLIKFYSYGILYHSTPMRYANRIYLLNENNEYYEPTEIVIPDTVKRIGDEQFYNFNKITKVIIPNSVTSIGAYAFNSCNVLTTIEIPNSVTSIGESAFEYCTNLTSIEFEEDSQLDSIANYAFENCVKLEKIEIPNSVTKIERWAFAYCDNLKEIKIKEDSKLTSIGTGILIGCKSLEKITIPFVGGTSYGTSNTHFGYIFGANSSSENETYVPSTLKEVIITGGDKISSSAFQDCYSLKTITIPKTIKTMGRNAFKSCSNLEVIYYNGTIKDWCMIQFDGSPSDYSNPMIYAEQVYILNEENKYHEPEELIIPDTVTNIGNYQFYKFKRVTNVIISNSVKSIGESAFNSCTSLESITLPFVGNTLDGTSNTHFGYIFGASSYLDNNSYVPSSLKEVIITSSKTIGSKAFYNCTNLTHIEIPNSVTTIGSSAFSGCIGLTEIEIPNSITEIDMCTFENCSSLTDIIIPEGVTRIWNYAFIGCSNLSNISLPSTLTVIYDKAFLNCSNLNNVYYNGTADMWNSNVKVWDGNEVLNDIIVFKTEKLILGININYNKNKVRRLLSNYSSISSRLNTQLSDTTLEFRSNGDGTCYVSGIGTFDGTELSIPEVTPNGDKVIGISTKAFSCCDKLESIIIPNSVISIGSYAFEYCSSLESIEIPESVTSIGSHAFLYCNLKTIKIPNSVTSIGLSAFGGCNNLETITIPFVGNVLDGTENTHFGYIFGADTYSENKSYVPSSLKQIIISNSKSIKTNAFFNCSTLTTILISNSVTSIGSSVFKGCSSLESITIPFIGDKLNNASYSHFGYIFGASIYNNNNSYVPSSLKEVIITNCTKIKANAFYNCSGLKKIEIPNSVTSIGSSAFKYCKGLEKIEIPNSVTSIGNSTLEGCTNLKSITIPFVGNSLDGVENTHFGYIFGASIYNNNNSYVPSSLKEVIITNCTKIKANAFYNCSGLKKIEIPNGVTTIGDSAFYNCTGLINIEIPNSVTSIGPSAFYNCTGLTQIKIPNSVTSIGSSAFYNCTGLTKIEIPNSVTSIGSFAFYNCTSLTKIEVPNSVTSIGKSAFGRCNNLETITIPFVGNVLDGTENTHFGYIFGASRSDYNNDYVPSSLKKVIITGGKSISYSSFFGCNNLESMTIPFVGNTLDGTDNTHFGYIFGAGSYSSNDLYVPTALKQVTITSGENIGRFAFYGCTSLTKIEIPNSVTSIGSYAFDNCTSLTKLEIPESVTSIGSYAFYNCMGFTNIEIPESVTSIGSNAFRGCTGLINIIIPENIVSIDDYLFYGCTGLINIEIPNSVTSIGHAAFGGCTNLETIIIPFVGNTLYETTGTNFGYIFGGNTFVPSSLKEVIITGGTRIDSSAFSGCTGLINIEIPNSVTSIGSSAFSGCTGLINIVIPNSVTSIGSSAFKNCTSLESITIPFVGNTLNGIENNYLGYIFSNEPYYKCYVPTSLKEVIITSGEIIGSCAFYNCSGLTNIEIPNSITIIGNHAFYNCSGLTNLEIPNGISYIGEYAFSGCNNLNYNLLDYGKYLGNATNPYLVLYELVDNITNFKTNQNTKIIYDEAFYRCSALNTITISNNINFIGKYVFENCKNLKDVFYNGNLEDWCNIQFNDIWANPMCYGQNFYLLDESNDYYELTELVIPNTVTNIGNNQFSGFNKITKVTIPNSVTTIGEYAFYRCWKLESITLPFVGNTVNGTENTHFGYIFGASSYSWNDDYVLSSLKEVIITGGHAIDSNAFNSCKDIESITIPNTIIEIKSNVFNNCNGLINLYYNGEYNEWRHVSKASDWNSGISLDKPECLREDSGVLFETSEDFEEFYISGYVGINGNAYVPDIYSGRHVTIVYDRAFDGNDLVTSITLPDTIHTIGQYAFRNCTNLESINFPKDLDTIEQGILYGCTSMVELVIPFLGAIREYEENESLAYYFGGKDYKDNALFVPDSLQRVTVFDAERISDYCFAEAVGLKEFVIPDGVTHIGIQILKNCNNIQSITIGASLESIDDYKYGYPTFGINKSASMLKKYIVSLDNNTFASDEYGVLYRTMEIPYTKGTENVPVEVIDAPIKANLTGYVIPDHIVSIAPYAFAYNNALRMIDLTYVRKISNNAFYQASNLINVTLGFPLYTEFEQEEVEFNDAIDKAVEAMKKDMDEGVWEQVYYQYIGDSAFRGCHSLLKIDIDSDNIVGIGDYAFADCPKLKTIMLGKNIEQLGLSVFSSTANGDSNIERFVVDEENIFFKSIDGVLYSINPDHSLTLEIFPAAAVVLHSSGVPTYEINGQIEYKDTFELPKGVYVSKIQTYAFQGTKELKHVILKPEDELILGDYAFANSQIWTVEIGENVTSIGLVRGEGEYTIFANADYLSEITVDDSNVYYSSKDGVLFDKDQKTLIKYPVNKLQNSYDIPNSVQAISAMAFKNNLDIESININSYISTIGLEAFYACENLKSISFKDVYAPISIMENAFTSYVEVENSNDKNTQPEIGYSLANYYDGINGEIGWQKYKDTYNLVENSNIEGVDPLPNVDKNKFYAVVVIDEEGNQLGDMLVSITDPYGKMETVRTSNGAEGKGTAMFYDLNGEEGLGFALDFELPYVIKVYDQTNIYYSYESTSIYLDEEMRVTYITLIRKPCDVTFNINGGEGNIETIDVLVGINPENGEAYTYQIENDKVSKPGYTLAGWSTSSDGAVKYTETFSSNKYKAHFILYAIWEPNINTLHFNINGGTTGEMADIKVRTDESITLPDNTFKKDGYEFIGWAFTSDGGVEYVDNEIFTCGINSEYTLYARYTANDNIFQFVSGGGMGTMESIIVKTDEEISVPSNEFMREGYTFLYWLDDNGNELYPGDVYTGTPSPVQTLTAVWEANTGILSFNKNKGNGSMESIELYTDKEINLPKTEFYKTGYVMIGWSTEADGALMYDSRSEFKMPPIVKDEEITLYAVWAEGPKVQGVSCDSNDINTQTFDLNKSSYDYTCPYTGSHSHGEDEVCIKGTIREKVTITVATYFDSSNGYTLETMESSESGIYQNGHKMANVKEAIINLDGSATVIFEVLIYELISEADMVARLSYSNKYGDVVYSETILNIHVFDFLVNENDVNLETDSLGVDLSAGGEMFTKLFGSQSFDISLGKNVKFTTEIEGDTIELKLSAKKTFTKTKSSNVDYQKEYENIKLPHNKNTYFFQFKGTVKDSNNIKHNLVYNVRFQRATEADNYYYYRCYIYEGKYENKISLFYGAVNGLNAQKSTRAELAPKAYLIYKSHIICAKEVKDIEKIKKLGKEAQYIESIKGEPIYENKHSFNMALNGNLIFQYDRERGLVPVSSEIKGTLEYTFTHNSQFMVWIIPITLEVEVTLGGEIILKLKFDENKKVSIDETTLTITGQITASVGVGCKVASAGVYGSIGTVFILDIYPEFGVNSWSANGSLGLYAKIGFKKYTKEIASFDGYIIEPKEKHHVMMLSNYSMASMYLVENYVNAEETDLEDDFRLLVIDGDIYKIGYSDVSSRTGYDVYNYAKLSISKWDGEKWSSPIIIDDNGKNDVAFTLYSHNGKLILAYTQIGRQLTENDDNYESFSNMTIKTFELNSDNINLIADGHKVDELIYRENYIYLAEYSIVNGVQTVVWVENADNNMFGVSPDNYIDANGNSHTFKTTANSIYMSKLVNGVWTDPTIVAQNLPTITDLAIGYNGEIAYIIDMNCDLSDATDRIMYYGNIDEEIIAFNHSTIGSILNVEFVENGIMYYYDVLVESDTEKDGLRYLLTDISEIIQLPSYIPETHKVLADLEGNIIGVFYYRNKTWTTYGESVTGSALYGVFNENGVWGQEVEIDVYPVEENRYIYSYDVAINPSENALMISLSTVDENGENNESFTLNYELKQNLKVSSYEINYGNSEIIIEVNNNGAKSSNVYICINGEYLLLDDNLHSGYTSSYVVKLTGDNDNKYNVSVHHEINSESIWCIEDIDMNYSDIVPYAKQQLIGGEDTLLLATRNNGNITDEAYTIVRIGEYQSIEIWNEHIYSFIEDLQLQNGDYGIYKYVNEYGEIEDIWVAKNSIKDFNLVYNQILLNNLINEEGIIVLSIGTISLSNNEKGNATDNNYTYVTYSNIENNLNDNGEIIYKPSINNSEIVFDPLIDESVEINYTFGKGDYISEIYINSNKLSNEDYTINFENENGLIVLSGSALNNITNIDGYYNIDIIFASNYSCSVKIKEVKYYKVTWINGNEITEETVREGSIPESPIEPVKQSDNEYTYKFIGWDRTGDDVKDSLSAVYQDTYYYTVWENSLKEYQVTWLMTSSDEKEIAITETYYYNDLPEYCGTIFTPEKMVFDCWDSVVTNVTSDITYTAKYIQEKAFGDVNGDNKINTRDVALLRQYVLGIIELPEEVLVYCNVYEDYNSDGSAKINTRDVALLQQYVLGVITDFSK